MDHPLFVGGLNPIPGMEKKTSGQRQRLLALLSLFEIEEIAKADPGEVLVVGAMMNATLTEIRGLEFYGVDSGKFSYNKTPNECLLWIEKRHSQIRFQKVDAEGLPDAQAKWFESLPRGHKRSPTAQAEWFEPLLRDHERLPNEGKFIHGSTYFNEVKSQRRDNEAAFRSFYESIDGRDPASLTRLHAWVTLECGRITYVDEFGGRPRNKVDGYRTEFSAPIVGGAAHVSCKDRTLLYGMPSLYMAYFQESFIKVRDVVPSAEEGVPGEEADVSDSDACAAGFSGL